MLVIIVRFVNTGNCSQYSKRCSRDEYSSNVLQPVIKYQHKMPNKRFQLEQWIKERLYINANGNDETGSVVFHNNSPMLCNMACIRYPCRKSSPITDTPLTPVVCLTPSRIRIWQSWYPTFPCTFRCTCPAIQTGRGHRISLAHANAQVFPEMARVLNFVQCALFFGGVWVLIHSLESWYGIQIVCGRRPLLILPNRCPKCNIVENT